MGTLNERWLFESPAFWRETARGTCVCEGTLLSCFERQRGGLRLELYLTTLCLLFAFMSMFDLLQAWASGRAVCWICPFFLLQRRGLRERNTPQEVAGYPFFLFS